MAEEEFEHFGDWLRTRRTEGKITVQELAERSQVPAATISAIELGLRMPSRLTLDAIIRGLISLGGIQDGDRIVQQYLSWQDRRNADISPAEKMIRDAYGEGDKADA